MPSLNDLGEFKFSFNRIALGRGKDDPNIDLPYDDLPLPTTEAVSDPSTGGFDFGAFAGGINANDPPPPLDTPAVDFDINAFLKEAGATVDEEEALVDTPADFDMDSLLGTDTTPAEDTASDAPADFDMDAFLNTDTAPAEDTASEAPADFDMSSFTEETSADAPADVDMDSLSGTDTTPAEDTASEAPVDFDMESFTEEAPVDISADFDMESFLGADTTPVEDTVDTPADFDMSSFTEEAPVDTPADFNMDSFTDDTPADTNGIDVSDGIDLGGESLDNIPADDIHSDEIHSDDMLNDDAFNIDGLDLGGTTATETFDDAVENDQGIDMGGESSDAFEGVFETPETGDAAPFAEDTFSADDFLSATDSAGGDFSGADFGEMPSMDIGSDFASDSIDIAMETGVELPASDESFDSGSGGFTSSEFELPGLEDIFEKSKTPISITEPKKGFFGRRKKRPEIEVQDIQDVEEIQLSQDELDRLLRTLASYPLNLRIACEEMIAEQVLLPQQLSRLIRMLIDGAHVKETAALAEEILGRPIIIPKSYEKMTGAAFEKEQASFAYIFIHNFLPVLRLFAIIAAFIASVIYLGYRFVYIPVKAENLYKRGYERISAGEYSRANELFHEAFLTHRKKKWFYSYAEAFRDQRRYLLAEQKYEELLRAYPRDKKGVLDYAYMQTYYLMNYEKANNLLQWQLLDYAPNDIEGLLAAGDNFLLWADSDPPRHYDKYEDARFCYARLLELKGWQVPYVERMLMYFIRTDNLKEVITLRYWFEDSNKRKLSPASIAELGGYLLDKQLEEVKGVPDAYLDSIESVRAMLLQAIMEDPLLPEPHYHLARYHHHYRETYEERKTLENAIRAFDLAKTETVRRRLYRVDAHYRYSNLLVNNREFFPAEEQAVRGIQLYEDYLNRNLLRSVPANAHLPLGRLYAAKGDLEYFVKAGNMEAALGDYRQAERYGYAPPEVLYRMGSAYYQQSDWGNALSYLFKASKDLPLNRRMLYALGNAAYQRGDYHAAQGYYDRLLDILENQRIRLPLLLPNDDPQFLELGERLMMARNNAGVVYQALGEQTGNRDYRSRAMGLYAESSRAWDSITRNPQSMVRMRLADSPGTPSINLGYLNANNALRPVSDYDPQIFPRIDKDVIEPSKWEELVPISGLQ